jgi:hypothetical protein
MMENNLENKKEKKEEQEENSNGFGVFLLAFVTGFICYLIILEILAEGDSDGIGGLVMMGSALLISVVAFVINFIVYRSKQKINWIKTVLIIDFFICLVVFLWCKLAIMMD